ncbi:MAG TPA: hypothetical protein VFS62_09945 [Chloroflexota bacterium]|nr:hypothetical protein [Chloroflexota bacterium]
MPPVFISGVDLSRGFYQDCVRPILDHDFPGLRYAAALIGTGSDVLGFDTPRSMDHHWGPRLYLHLSAEDIHLRCRSQGAVQQRAFYGAPS